MFIGIGLPLVLERTSGDSTLASGVGTVANDGATIPLYSSIREAMVYDASQSKTVFAYEGWNGSARKAYVSYYDHSTGIFGDIVDSGITTLTDDDHGVPAIVKDHEGYWHLFGGSHTGNIQYASSSGANDVSQWTARSALTGNQGYPHPVLVGSNLYLFNREGQAGADQSLKLRVTSALSGGVATWGSELSIVDLEGDNGQRVYAGNFIVVDAEIWFVATRGEPTDTQRSDVYFFRYDTATGGVKNFAGDTTIASGDLPVDRTEADASFLIYDHTDTDVGADIPVWVIDDSDNPYVFFAVGPVEGPYDVVMHYNIGAGWVTEDTGVDVIGRFATFAPVRLSDGSIDLYYPDGSDPWPDDWRDTPSPLDGHVNKVTRSAGGTWGTPERILTATDFPIGRFVPSLNAHDNARVIMAELADSNDDDDAGGHRLFIHGASGFLARPPGVQNIVAPSISGTASVGNTLTVDVGEWRAYPQPISYAYQWFADGVEISGATSSTYELTIDELGTVITVRVTGTDADTLQSLPVTSSPTSEVEESALAYYQIQPIYIPSIPNVSVASSLNFNTLVMDATGEKVAIIGPVWTPDRTSKSIRKVGFRFGSVTKSGGSGLTLSLQDVDTANGPVARPDETQDQTYAIANADASFAANTWYLTGNLSADRAVDCGDLVAIVFEYDGDGRQGSDTVAISGILTLSASLQSLQSVIVHKTSGNWANQGFLPICLLEFSDGTFGTLGNGLPVSSITFANFNSGTVAGSGGDERAAEFTLPAGVKVDGVWFAAAVGTDADADIILYDSEDNVLASKSIDSNAVRNTGGGIVEVIFDSEVTLSPNQTYRLALKPTTTNNALAEFSLHYPVAAYREVTPWGTNWAYTSRTDGGSWASATDTKHIACGLRISQIQG